MLVSWTIERYNVPTSTWVPFVSAYLDNFLDELNAHSEVVIKIPNTAANRLLVSNDIKVRLTYSTTVLFTGLLPAPSYSQALITCTCYIEVFEAMKKKTITGTFTNVPANTIFAAVCTAAGVTAGTCPTTPLSVKLIDASCFNVAKYLAAACRKDFWGDYDGSSNPRFNIGDRGAGIGSPKSITTPVISDHGTDRSKVRNHVIIHSLDELGNDITGQAYWNGAAIIEGAPPGGFVKYTERFTERMASDATTANHLAANKLEELRKDSTNIPINVSINEGYNIYPGDYVAITNASLALAGNYRVYRATKTLGNARLEIDTSKTVYAEMYLDLRAYEDLGIYPTSATVSWPMFRVVSQGQASITHPIARGLYNAADNSLIAQGNRSYHVSIFDRILNDWVYHDTYDVFGAPGEANNLASLLNSCASNTIVVIHTYDEPQTNRLTGGLEAAMLRCGASRTIFSSDYFKYRSAYILVGIPGCGEGNGLELYSGDTDSDTNAWCDMTFIIIEGNLNLSKSNKLHLSDIPGTIADITDLIPLTPSPFTSSNITQGSKLNADGSFDVWFDVTIPNTVNASRYILEYKRSVDSDWVHLEVPQPSSGNPIVRTGYVERGSLYDFRVCSVGILGTCSAWSATATKLALDDTTPPGTPTGLVATSVQGGVVVEWTPNTEADISHYEIWRMPAAGVYAKVSDSFTNYFFWKAKVAGDYVLQSFKIKAVDLSGNASSFSSVVTATPVNLSSTDLTIEMRPWTSDIKVYEDASTPHTIHIDNILGIAPIHFTFADGTTFTLPFSSAAYTPGTWYIYWTYYTPPPTYGLARSSNYADAVGSGKGLIAIVQVPVLSTNPCTILQFDSYTPTIGTGAIAAKAIFAQHLSTSELITDTLQIKNGIVTSDKILNISAPKVIFTTGGDVEDWASVGALTQIYGGNLQTGTVNADRIIAGTFTIDRMLMDLQRTIGSTLLGVFYEAEDAAISLWPGTTILADPTASSGSCIQRLSSAASGTMWYGPYLNGLKGGNYWAAYRLKVASNVSTSTVLQVDVNCTRGGGGVQLGSLIITPSMFSASNTWQTFMIPVEVRNNDTTVEIRGMGFVTGITAVYCDWVKLIPAGLITANILAANSVLANNIIAGAVTTPKLGLNRVIGDSAEALLNLLPGNLWWRSDLNQLRFRSDVGIERILKEPLYAAQAENGIANASFEVEGALGLPYGWDTVIETGTAVFARTSNQQYHGGFSASIQCTGAGQRGRFDSYLIPVVPGKIYFASVHIRGSSAGSTTYATADVRWYDKYKVALGSATTFGSTSFTTTWTQNFTEMTVPANAYFCKVCILNIEFNGIIYFDNVIFSEQRTYAPSVYATTRYYDEFYHTMPGTPGGYVTGTKVLGDVTSYDRFVIIHNEFYLDAAEPDNLFDCEIQTSISWTYGAIANAPANKWDMYDWHNRGDIMVARKQQSISAFIPAGSTGCIAGYFLITWDSTATVVHIRRTITVLNFTHVHRDRV